MAGDKCALPWDKFRGGRAILERKEEKVYTICIISRGTFYLLRRPEFRVRIILYYSRARILYSVTDFFNNNLLALLLGYFCFLTSLIKLEIFGNIV